MLATFTSFTSTRVQILAPEELSDARHLARILCRRLCKFGGKLHYLMSVGRAQKKKRVRHNECLFRHYLMSAYLGIEKKKACAPQ